jgi:hypothetical protein
MTLLKSWLPVLLILSLSAVALSQAGRETLTNTKIIELVRLGLSEPLIVAKINRSDCQCDTSTTAISRLKAARVSDAIIMAMMDAQEQGSQPARMQAPTPSVPLPYSPAPKTAASTADNSHASAGAAALSQITEPGIYLFEDGKMTAIEPSVFSGTKANFLKGALTYGIMKTKFRAKVRQKSANLKVSSGQPVFYFVFNPDYKNSGATMAGNLWWGMPATSPAEFMLVQMNVKEASREAVMGEYGAFTGMSTGARDQDVREYSFEKIKPGVYKVTPKTNLAAGEYCFYYAGNVVGLGFAGGKVFDFSVG